MVEVLFYTVRFKLKGKWLEKIEKTGRETSDDEKVLTVYIKFVVPHFVKTSISGMYNNRILKAPCSSDELDLLK